MVHLAYMPRRQLAGQYRRSAFAMDRPPVELVRASRKSCASLRISSRNEAGSVAEFCVPTAKAFLTNTRVLAPSFGIATRSAVLRSIRKNSAKLDPRIVASLVVIVKPEKCLFRLHRLAHL